MSQYREQIHLPRNLCDAVELIAEKILGWNAKNPDHLIVTCTAKDRNRLEYKKHSHLPYANDEYTSQFCLITKRECRDENYIPMPFDTLDKFDCVRIEYSKLEYELWKIADWDLSEFPYYDVRGFLPRHVMYSLCDARTCLFPDLSIWNYVLPGFVTDAAFKEWTGKYGLPRFMKCKLEVASSRPKQI